MLCGSLFAGDIASGTLTASEGLDFRVDASGTPRVGRIEGVAPGSRAATAGLRGGLVPFEKRDPDVRYRLLNGVYPRERLSVVVMRDGRIQTIVYITGPGVPGNSMGSAVIRRVRHLDAFFAVLLAWRRPESPEARALSAFLASNWLFGNAGSGNWASPWLPYDIGLALVGYVAQCVSPALLAYYAGLFLLRCHQLAEY